MTPEGRAEQQDSENEAADAPSANECFVILPIGMHAPEVRKRSDHIFNYVISETLAPLGYDVIRADKIDRSGAITTQIIEHLLAANVVIADLSDVNPNVFYELGVLHAFRRPFVQIMTEGQPLPFDVQNLRTIFVNVTDLDSVHQAKKDLKGMIRAIEGGAEVDTPIHHTASMQTLKASDNSESRAIAEIYTEITAVKKIISTRPRATGPNEVDFQAMREFIEYLARNDVLVDGDADQLTTQNTSLAHDSWAHGLNYKPKQKNSSAWDSDDPWASAPAAGASSATAYDDEPPF